MRVVFYLAVSVYKKIFFLLQLVCFLVTLAYTTFVWLIFSYLHRDSLQLINLIEAPTCYSRVTKNKDTDCARKPLFLTNILCPIMYASLLAGLVYMLTYFDNIEIKGLNIKLDRGTRRKHVILVCRPGRFSFIVANEKIVPK